jgi:hypothetical protein
VSRWLVGRVGSGRKKRSEEMSQKADASSRGRRRRVRQGWQGWGWGEVPGSLIYFEKSSLKRI